MKPVEYPRLLLPEGFDERAAFEVSSKGWLSTQVETYDGRLYPIFFYDPVRLQQDLEDGSELCLAEPGMVVLPEVTVEAAEAAVRHLWLKGYFNHLQAQQKYQTQPIQIPLAA
jgi:hypothetical protein